MAYNNKQINRYLIITIMIIMTFSFSATIVSGPVHTIQAATPSGNEDKTYTLLEPLPYLPNSGQINEGGQVKNINLGSFIQYAFNLLIAVAAVAAVFMMVYGGFLYMTSDAWSKKSEGITKFKNAIYGLLMVLSAFLILRTVNPKLVEIPKSIPPIDVPASQMQSPMALFDQMLADAQADRQRLTSELIFKQDQTDTLVSSLSDRNAILRGELRELLSSGENNSRIQVIEDELAENDAKILNAESIMSADTTKAIIQTRVASQTFLNLNSMNIISGLDLNKITAEISTGVNEIDKIKRDGITELVNLGSNDATLSNSIIMEAEKAKISLQLNGLDAQVQLTDKDHTFLAFENNIIDPSLNKIAQEIYAVQDPTIREQLRLKYMDVKKRIDDLKISTKK